ncbi:MAG: BTAD domain-containing putative transcriptional regulator [Elainellaceae cyanobacterium]
MSLVLRIQVLGELFITYGDRPLAGITTARSQALLAYLLLHRHTPQPRQRIAFDLWRDSVDAQARSNLRKELSYLRRDLPDANSFLLAETKTLQWSPTAPFMLDVLDFENAVNAAEQTTDLNQARSLLERAVQLYQGDLLPSCEDEWIVPERERLRQMRGRTVEQLIDVLKTQQDYRTAIGYAQQLLRIDSLNESTYASLMQLHSLSGDRASALQVYYQCMATLRDELGIDPSSTTRDLYQRILSEDEPSEESSIISVSPRSTSSAPYHDWGDAIDVSVFYGCDTERSILHQWIVHNGCRLVLLLGIGGIGKTALAVKLAQDVQAEFECVIWRSLRNAPPLETLLADLVLFLSNQQDTTADVERFIHWLRMRRCLVVLDNLETIFQAGDRAGQYRPNYEAYGELFRALGELQHQSCVILTSREKPAEIATLEGAAAVRTLQLSGSLDTAMALIESRNLFGSEADKQLLARQYGCNPLALKIVASSIQDLFDGDIDQFLQQNAIFFSGTRQLLEEQFERLSALEQTIMIWLAINREWTAIAELADDILSPVSRASLLEALQSLSWRSLIEKRSGYYTQQPVVMEYVTHCLVEQITDELLTKQLNRFNQYALIKTTANDYVRESQTRLILAEVAGKLRHAIGDSVRLEQQLWAILAVLHAEASARSDYAVGNLLNLCCYLEMNLTGYDFSNLKIRHAYLRKANLHHVNLQNSDLTHSTFSQMLGGVLAVAFSPSGQLLATGDNRGQVQVWRVADGQLLLTLADIPTNIYSVVWSPDGEILASGSGDHTIKLWPVSTGQCLKTLQGHTNWILSLAWSPDGKILASGSQDSTVRYWDTSTGQCLKRLNHAGAAWCVAWSPDSQILASGGTGGTINLWDTSGRPYLESFSGHRDVVWALDWHPEGQILASSSSDQSIKLWDISRLSTPRNSTKERLSKECLRTLNGHSNWVLSVAWTPDGQFLVSGSADHTIRLWDKQDGHCLKTLQGHSNWVWSVACSRLSKKAASNDTASQKSLGLILASGADDEAVKFWDLQTGQCLKTLQGYRDYAWSISWHPKGQMLASGGASQVVRIWDTHTGQCIRTLEGHDDWVYAVAYSPTYEEFSDEFDSLLASGSRNYTAIVWTVPISETGQEHGTEPPKSECWKTIKGYQNVIWCVAWNPNRPLLAVGSMDGAIRFWATDTGQCIQTLDEHRGWVMDIDWSTDGHILASSSQDKTVKLWNSQTGQCLNTLEGHELDIWAVAWNPHQALVASGSFDKTVKLWNPDSGDCLQTLCGHASGVLSIAWSPDGNTLASGSSDNTIRLWSVETGRCLRTLEGHHNWVMSVSFASTGDVLASSSQDETIRLWDWKTGQCLKVLRATRPYEGMNITGVTGLTEAQKSTLRALGAIEVS